MHIGIDLDNTIINYDGAFLLAAKERGLIPGDFKGSKQQVRDYIRELPQGELKWQKLQGYVYGKGLEKAELFPGVVEFLESRAAKNDTMTIVSHKTQFGHYDPDKVDLRIAAQEFLARRGINAHIAEANIFFATTREEKVQKITELQCDIFIDDLEEVFLEATFPSHVKKYLFSSLTTHTQPDWVICPSWEHIAKSIK
jgi:hypothetical protein